MFSKNVRTTSGKLVELKVGFGNKIYLDGNETGYKVGGDGKVYTNQGRLVSDKSPEEVLRLDGKIKGFFHLKEPAKAGSFFFFKL